MKLKKKEAQNSLSYPRRAHPDGTLVKVDTIERDQTGRVVVPLGTMGLVIGGCPNPWYNQVQIEDGRVLPLFCEDFTKVEVE